MGPRIDGLLNEFVSLVLRDNWVKMFISRMDKWPQKNWWRLLAQGSINKANDF